MSRCGTQFAISIDELKEMAHGQTRQLCQHLLPNGRENTGYWETSNITDQHTGSYSLKVNLTGANRGLWTDFGAAKGSPDRGGNMIQLVAMVKFNGRIGDACSWLRSWLGLDHLDPGRLATEKAKASRAAAANAVAAEERAGLNRRKAHGMWLSAVPIPDTPAEKYLCSRGLDFRKAGLNAPAVLRFHPEIYCTETRSKLPAMVAAINDLAGAHLGTHRTWIQPNGSGKAALVEAKKSIGKYQGGFIHLWKGEHRCHLRDLPPTAPVVVSEGIEDGLSAVLAKPSIRCIAGISLSNIGSLELPPQCPVHLLRQRDTKERAIDAFEGAVARLQERGYNVFLIDPPVGVKDYNDALMGSPQPQPSQPGSGEQEDPDGDPNDSSGGDV